MANGFSAGAAFGPIGAAVGFGAGAGFAARAKKKASKERRRFRGELRIARARARQVSQRATGGEGGTAQGRGFQAQGEFLRREFEGGELQRRFVSGLRAQQATSGLFTSGARQESFAAAGFQQQLRGQLQPALTEQSFAPERLRLSAFQALAPDIGQLRPQEQQLADLTQSTSALFGGQPSASQEGGPSLNEALLGIRGGAGVDPQELLTQQFSRAQSRRRLTEEQELELQRQEASRRLTQASPLLRRGGQGSVAPSEIFKLGGLASNTLLQTGGFDVFGRGTTGEANRRLTREELAFREGEVGTQREGQRRLQTAREDAPSFQQQTAIFGREGALQRMREEAEQRGRGLLADRAGARNVFGVAGSGPGGRS